MPSNHRLIPPTTEPDAEPTYPLLINGAWIPVLVGLVENTQYQNYWEVSDEDWPNLSDRIDKLIDILQHPD